MSRIPGCACHGCTYENEHLTWPKEKNPSPIAPLEGGTPVRYAAFNALLREIKTLHDSKGADYEDGGEEYANLTAAEAWGVPAWKYAMLRVNEKMNRLKAYAKGSTLQNEGVRDSMIDIAVLSLIAIVLKERA